MFTFFQKSIFGLDISDYSIEIISLGGSFEKPKLLAMARKVLEPGIVKDGKILQKEKLKSALQFLIREQKFGKIKARKLIFTIPESRSFIHVFEAPKSFKKEKIKKEAELQITRNFPFAPQDLYFDFKIREGQVLLVAAPKNIVDDYLEVFKELKLKPLVLEIESLSLARSLIENKEETILIADIGARTTNFSIFDKNILKLSITINTAGDKFTKALTEKLELSSEKAENIKKEIGLSSDKEEGKILLILQKEIQKITTEIKKIDNYFQEKESKSFEKIILAGGSSSLPHLVEYLAENLEMPVILGDPWRKINIDILKKKEYFEKALDISPILYATVIGSALRGLTRNPKRADINLINKF